MKTLILDNFLSEMECDFFIEIYEKNKNFSKKFRDVYPLDIPLSDSPDFLKSKLNKISKDFNAEIDWLQIVKWPISSKQDLHFDNASDNTVLTSITYLNDNFTGGQTYFEKDITFIPKRGRSIFFDGKYYKHGVTPVEKNVRYVVAVWYKPIIDNITDFE